MDDALYSASVICPNTSCHSSCGELCDQAIVIVSLHIRDIYICTGLCARTQSGQSGQSGHNIWFHFSSSSNPILRFYDP